MVLIFLPASTTKSPTVYMIYSHRDVSPGGFGFFNSRSGSAHAYDWYCSCRSCHDGSDWVFPSFDYRWLVDDMLKSLPKESSGSDDESDGDDDVTPVKLLAESSKATGIKRATDSLAKTHQQKKSKERRRILSGN